MRDLHDARCEAGSDLLPSLYHPLNEGDARAPEATVVRERAEIEKEHESVLDPVMEQDIDAMQATKIGQLGLILEVMLDVRDQLMGLAYSVQHGARP